MFLIVMPGAVLADSDDGHRRWGREFKEEFRAGNCKVKRKQDKNGEYEEERKCRPPFAGRGLEFAEFQEEFRDGPCKVKRKQDRNGEYEEERKCHALRHHPYRQAPAPDDVPVPPPVVVVPGVTVQGTVRIPY